MIEGEVVPFREGPVYTATIEPTIRLWIDRLDGAQVVFLNALREIQSGKLTTRLPTLVRPYRELSSPLAAEATCSAGSSKMPVVVDFSQATRKSSLPASPPS